MNELTMRPSTMKLFVLTCRNMNGLRGVRQAQAERRFDST
jgi:hypothetical protein